MYRFILSEQSVSTFDVALEVIFIRNLPVFLAACRQTHFFLHGTS